MTGCSAVAGDNALGGKTTLSHQSPEMSPCADLATARLHSTDRKYAPADNDVESAGTLQHHRGWPHHHLHAWCLGHTNHTSQTYRHACMHGATVSKIKHDMLLPCTPSAHFSAALPSLSCPVCEPALDPERVSDTFHFSTSRANGSVENRSTSRCRNLLFAGYNYW